MKHPTTERPPNSLLLFQAQYSAHLRNPKKYPRPVNIPEARSQIYQSLLFNNLCTLISPCFPVTRQILGQEKWLELCRVFYEHWSCSTPYFSRVAYEMVEWVQDQHRELVLSEWQAELMHYEWVELQVETSAEQVIETHGTLSAPHRLRLNPTLMNLSYRWPVHTIGPGHEPQTPAPTHLLVYRTHQHQVRFIEANLLTGALLSLIEQNSDDAEQVLTRLAEKTPEIPYPRLLQFGTALIEDLAQNEALMICN